MTYPGPCCICGGTDYELSCGGPTICPQCDCGNFTPATVLRQAKEMGRLRAALESLTEDPPATLDEPDPDWEVIIKMRNIAREALGLPHGPVSNGER